MEITLTVNNEKQRIQIEPNEMLADVLRNKLGYTEIKKGCGNGECGSCTIVMNGKAVTSCITLAAKADGANILTAKGLVKDGEIDIIQKCFIEYDAIQCGYCTPGMVMSAKALLDSNPNPTEAEVRLAISGNLCRCTGYEQIVEAILAASKEYKSAGVTNE